MSLISSETYIFYAAQVVISALAMSRDFDCWGNALCFRVLSGMKRCSRRLDHPLFSSSLPPPLEPKHDWQRRKIPSGLNDNTPR